MSGGAQAGVLFAPFERLAEECRESAEFQRRFGTEQRCVEWLRDQRWPGGFSCERCHSGGIWCPERRGYLCRGCSKLCSVTAGTVLHGARKPLRKWFEAIFLIVQRGVSARTLQREIGLTYKVAWTWGHKLRWLLGSAPTPEVRFEAERTMCGEKVRRPEADVPGPCGCTKLAGDDWKWESEMDEEEAVARLERLERLGTPRCVSDPPRERSFEEPRNCSTYAHHELLATYYGSLSEKHLRSYLDELAFREEGRKRRPSERFVVVGEALAGSSRWTYRQIVAKGERTGYALSIIAASRRK